MHWEILHALVKWSSAIVSTTSHWGLLGVQIKQRTRRNGIFDADILRYFDLSDSKDKFDHGRGRDYGPTKT
ncbi:uncharacterized protein EAF01_003348 [Botrytis porri]|uniref:uncharacterized protein n=1 Tax=Botrytis porri TaxID=87229 RepID=UPI0018FF5E45|nr:uncharacterized protein EAF01_003348 [Botrytis porri]KAF7909630.1 hypothetical protein EAF01_003348 [Botrytis porri]